MNHSISLGLLLCACSHEPAAGPSARLVRPTLRRVSAEPLSAARRLFELPLPEDPAGWSVTGDAEIIAGVNGPVLRLSRGQHGMTLPTRGLTGTWNRLSLRIRSVKAVLVSVGIDRRGGRRIAPGGLSAPGSELEQRLDFDLPRPMNLRSVQGLVLDLSARGTSEIVGVELWSVPLHERLAPAGSEDADGLASVLVEREARPAVGLVPDDPVVTELLVEHESERLAFALGLPDDLGVRPEAARVVLTLTAPGATREHEWALDPDPDAGWTNCTVPLREFVGTELQASFRFEGAQPSETLCALADLRIERAGPTPPLVLLVTSDTHRADHLGCTSPGFELSTPALDALAARGVRFDDAWSGINITLPSHASLMTGRSPRDTRVVQNSQSVDRSETTLAELFGQAGWRTLAVVSVAHLAPVRSGLEQGFDRMRTPPRHSWRCEDAVDHLLEMIDQEPGQPVFAWLHLFDAHLPYNPPEPFDRLYYEPGKDPAAPEIEQPWDPLVRSDLAGFRDPEFLVAQYRAEISYLDHALGLLFAHPRVAAGTTAVTSDHGEVHIGAGTWFNHRALLLDTLRVPLLLAGPTVPVGRCVRAPARSYDVGRTLLDLSGLAGAEFPGSNLLARIEHERPELERFALAGGGNAASLAHGDRFLVLNLHEHADPVFLPRERHQVTLYDLRGDAICEHDLARAEPDVARDMRRRVVEWLHSAAPPTNPTTRAVRAEDLEALAALGYAESGGQVGGAWIDPDCTCEHCATWR